MYLFNISSCLIWVFGIMSNTDFSCIAYYCVTVEWNWVCWVVCTGVYLRCQATLERSTGRWSVVLCIGHYGLRVGVGAECFRAHMRWCLSWCQREITRASANWQQYIQHNQPQLLAFQMSHQRFLTFQGPNMWFCFISGGHCIQICTVCRIGCTCVCI